ncbi:MAG TPA: Mu transposase C-terminal domain-containing protein [Streptosporangiaceae bacterium]|nr:Mu transposase C-terminal domain-containing protein [Streptosporangiaceae bacterium]
MSDTKARVLRPGHRIALGQDVYTVIQLNGTTVTLQDHHGELSAMLLGYLLTAPGFAAIDAAPPRRAPQDGRLSILDEAEQQRIRWLEGHLIEVETGRHPEGPVHEAYDPELHSLDERELTKVAELRAEGTEISQRSLQRLRQAYRDNGLIGLADKRALRSQTPGAAVDPRVVDAAEDMLADPRGRSTLARSAMFAQLQRKLDEIHGPGEVPMPSRATFYRLMNHMDRGRRNFVSEASRRVSVNRPDRPFTPVTALRPGEDVPIDTNKLDIMCRYADGVVRRAELTMAVDVATRSILGGVIAPTTKAVDAAAVLARMLVPEPMRPGWAESLHHAHSVIPHERLLSIDERFANAAAKPVIIPETINCDRGRVYLSETFMRACATLGISVQPARPYTGSDKSLVERTFASINTLFCQHVAGYTGRDTTRRGPDVAEDAVWTVAQIQELFDEWVVACWQNRPHEGLSHTWGEGRDLSPNEMYTACVGISGYVPLPLTGDDYIELLPAVFRTVNDYGLTIDNRTYDCKALNPYRRLDSGLRGGNKQWEVHYDPYDITVVWLRDHRSEEWITAPWVYRSLAGQPFGLALWEHARRVTTERSGPRPAEADVARNVADLLKRASGQNLSADEARAVAVDANRPAHPKAGAAEDPVPERQPDEDLEQPDPVAADPSAYEVFDPDGVRWRL